MLDEPNANLDAAGEEALVRGDAGAEDEGVTTVVLVTHKVNILSMVDKMSDHAGRHGADVSARGTRFYVA